MNQIQDDINKKSDKSVFELEHTRKNTSFEEFENLNI